MAVAYDPNKDYAAEINKAKQNGASQSVIESLEQQRAQKIADANDSQLASWGVNRAGQSLREPAPPHGPETLNKAEMTTLTYQNVKNDITINSGSGQTTQVTGYILNGHSYILNEDGTGTRLLDYGDGKGIIKAENIADVDWKTDFHTALNNNYVGTATILLNDSPKQQTYRPSPPPPPPPFISFNEQPPTFSSNLKEVHKFSYFFGVDKLELKNTSVNQNCCFISQDIPTGELIQNGHIQLDAEYTVGDSSSVEFYIVDGDNEVPILTVNQEMISNEKIFFGLTTRFLIDEDKKYEIKRNGLIYDITLEKAMESTDALYTISYTPVTTYNYKPINSSIKIKIIMRVYDKNTDAPYVSKLKIRKFGGETLWQQNISVL